ncbi:MAG: helix-turn-helix domain-containing protein [Eubacterium sp.]
MLKLKGAMIMNNQDFGKFISALRKEKGLTQIELAEKINVSDKAISRWENGKNYPDIEVLEILGKELGVSISELIACKKIDTPKEAELETAKVYVEEVRKTKKLSNKVRTLFTILLIIIIILFLPTSFKTYNDGGTREYQALIYKVVKWNRFLGDSEKFYHHTSIYWLSDSQKLIDELWKSEKLYFYHLDTYIDDIKNQAMNIGAEMPNIVYMDHEYVVFNGACGIIVYNYQEQIIENRISNDCLQALGYDLPYVYADAINKLIYIECDPFVQEPIPPLKYSIDSRIIERIDCVPEIQEKGNIEELESIKRIEKEKKGFLTSSSCYNCYELTGYLIADDDWNTESIKFVIDSNGKERIYNIFKAN